jgi:hypothetical protein
MAKVVTKAAREVRCSLERALSVVERGAGGQLALPADARIARLPSITTCRLRLGDCHPPFTARKGLAHTDY